VDLVRREKLRERLSLHSRFLLINFTNEDSRLGDTEVVVRRQARYEGAMALGLLGQAWFDRFAGAKGENYVQVQHRLEVAKVETPWTDTIKHAGDQIGKRYRQMPLEVERLLKPDPKAEKTPAPAA